MEFLGFMAVVLVVLVGITLAKVGNIRRQQELIWQEQQRMAIRMDAVRDQLKKQLVPSSPDSTVPKQPLQPAPVPPPVVPVVPPATVKKLPVAVPPPFPPPAPPAVVRPEPLVASAFAESVRDILGRIGNWLLVGEEFRSKGVTTEFAVASTWLLRLSILAIIAGAGFFVNWSIQQNLIGPAARVAIGLGVGIGLLAGGMKLVGRRFNLIGQGLLGGGIVICYLNMFAMGSMQYKLVGMPTVFALMILVTVAAGVVAVRAESLLVAVIGLAGGFLTPVLVRTGSADLPAFYGYLLLLNLGIFGVASVRQWRLLNYLGFVFTYGLFIASARVYQRTDFPVAMTFLCALFVAQSALVYVHNILHNRKSTVLEIIHLVANAGIFAALGYGLVEDAHGRPYPALLSLGLAFYYTAHVYAMLRRQREDRNLLVALMALAGVFATWTLPLVMEKESLTIGFSLLAFMFLWLGHRVPSQFLQGLSHLVYAIVFYRLLFMDMPRNFDMMPTSNLPLADYWKAMAGRFWTFGTAIGSIVAAFRLTLRVPAPQSVEGREGVAGMVEPLSKGGHLFFWSSILLVFLVLHLEINTMFQYWRPFRMPALTLLWCGMAGFFLWRYLAGDRVGKSAFWALCVFAGGVLFKLFVVDLNSWRYCDRMFYNMEYGGLFVLMRLLDFAMVIALLALMARTLSGRADAGQLTPVFGYAGLSVFFLWATFEANTFLYWKLRDFQGGGLTVLWSLFAIVFVAVGIWKNLRLLRYLGLLLFAIVAWKVFMVDLRGMSSVYRVLAFMVIGLALLAGSFAYLASSRKFKSDTDERGGDV